MACQVSKPWGELSSYDFVIGKTGRFVSVQVKSTLSKLGTGYVCTVRGGHQAYAAGSFDFLAAYVMPADAWYIIPADIIQGKECLVLYPNFPTAKYEKYREAWHLLREAVGTIEVAEGEIPKAETSTPPNRMEQRMMASFNFVRRHWER